MRKGMTVFAAAAAAALCLTAAGARDTHASNPQAQPLSSGARASATVLGKPENAKWTPTTWESATSEAHRKVLQGGRRATVTGEVVDVSCYLQLGKRGEDHVPCGTKCIANGQPIGLVDSKGILHLLMAEEHHPRRDGQVELKSVFGPLLAKIVTVNGMMVEMKGYRALFVQASEIGGTVKAAEAEK